jgi:hypothetical protein
LQVSAEETRRNVRRSFELTQLKRSSFHLEKRLVAQKIREHEMTLQVLRERMVEIETNIASTARAVGHMHCYMLQAGIPAPKMPDHVAASIMFSEVSLNLFFTMHIT